MTTPLTITSLSQGKLNAAPKSDEDYWARYQEAPALDDLPHWYALKIEWPHWALRRRADRA